MPSPPPCVGQFELGDPTCNGDPDGDSVESRTPCAWRDRCSGLQIYCQGNGFTADEVAATLEYKTLVNLCEKYVEEHSISQGVPGGPEPEPEDPEEDDALEALPEPVKAKPASKGKRKKPKSERRFVSPNNKGRRKKKPKAKPKARPAGLQNGMSELRSHFTTLMHDLFPNRRFASGNRVLVRPGQFYELDRIKGSRYVSWYCTVPRGRDLAIACIRFKPRLGCVHVELPVDVEDMRGFLSKEQLKKLNPEPCNDGQFLSICKNLDEEGVGLVVEALRTLIESDLIALP